jgi:hypothetical protein
MSEKILGYYFDYEQDKWYPIYKTPPGYIVTQAFILCGECRSAISSTGGPKHGSVCLTCWDNQRLFDFIEGKKND